MIPVFDLKVVEQRFGIRRYRASLETISFDGQQKPKIWIWDINPNKLYVDFELPSFGKASIYLVPFPNWPIDFFPDGYKDKMNLFLYQQMAFRLLGLDISFTGSGWLFSGAGDCGSYISAVRGFDGDNFQSTISLNEFMNKTLADTSSSQKNQLMRAPRKSGSIFVRPFIVVEGKCYNLPRFGRVADANKMYPQAGFGDWGDLDVVSSMVDRIEIVER
jgi:hypothetical protein